MATSNGPSKAAYHVRSTSLPARSHPVAQSIEVHLNRLRSCDSASSSACNKLSVLRVLYECVDDLLQLPLTQNDISPKQHCKSVDKMLDGFLMLLDVCSTTKDIFIQMKECLQELESSLRRRKCGESELPIEVETYLASRKKLNKAVTNCFKNLKTEKRNSKESNAMPVHVIMKEVEEISAVVFESLLLMISQPKATLRSSSWWKYLSGKEGEKTEVKRIDSELLALKSSKDISQVQMHNALKVLKSIEPIIRNAEEELEFVYRQLLKTRVTILNMVNH